ncbi:hypothetical protein HPB48_005232 [Haemaphysalis longicornis]|uniref:Uncharacterized protein n=1 Tax=Haemaphysalis longicornis TaxID=44386 RepID=A0A9J6FF97_HAELO|nr:hypothetical protein HPB48_005232 [Haemaphysalis longicornis]
MSSKALTCSLRDCSSLDAVATVLQSTAIAKAATDTKSPTIAETSADPSESGVGNDGSSPMHLIHVVHCLHEKGGPPPLIWRILVHRATGPRCYRRQHHLDLRRSPSHRNRLRSHPRSHRGHRLWQKQPGPRGKEQPESTKS